jgi:hypothetical protein
MIKAKILGIVLFSLLLAACMPFQGMVKPNVAAQNEIVVTAELKAMLAANPRPKIVIRVPSPPTNVTEADRFNTYINIIEKTFMQHGFIVRDRALLETLMRSGNINYQGIQKTIDTDLIIDILSLEFNSPNPQKAFFNQKTKRFEMFATTANYVDCPKARLECRVTIVDKGQLGGLFTLFASRCDMEDLIFLVQPSRALMMWPNNPNSAWLPALSAPIESEELRRIYTQYLTTQLMNQLVAQLFEALGMEGGAGEGC